MDMVFGDVSSNYLYLVSVTDFSDKISGTSTDTARQYGLAVLSGPYKVVFAIKYCMRSLSV
jgi:hypothetical protein